jgi:hypothetical protein
MRFSPEFVEALAINEIPPLPNLERNLRAFDAVLGMDPKCYVNAIIVIKTD